MRLHFRASIVFKMVLSLALGMLLDGHYGARACAETSAPEQNDAPASTAPLSLRLATFNIALSETGGLIDALATPTSSKRARLIAQIIQVNDPDILLLNEFDYEASGRALDNFRTNYLEVSQEGAAAIEYKYVYIAPVNTGVHSGFDLDNNGKLVADIGTAGYADDTFGYGLYPGQYGMALLSKYPIDYENIRTFQHFLWQDMPGNLLPPDPLDTDGDSDRSHYFNTDERARLRLSSKSHWDIPVRIAATTVHVLCGHPTPPTFDDGTETDLNNPSLVDENGRRNHDEIRFWADYITDQSYIYDDDGVFGGLASGAKFVILGDYNADDDEGDSTGNPAFKYLTTNPLINNTVVPTGEAGPAPSDTAGFNGGMRIDYALPSANQEILDAAVYWPATSDIETASDHRMVWVEVKLD